MTEAWSKASRTADGMYNSRPCHIDIAANCYKKGCEIERELTAVTEQRDRLTEAVNAATILIAAKGRHNTMLAYNGLRDALQSLTKPNEP
jgi:hypothetical protein